MSISTQTQALLLLTGRFGGGGVVPAARIGPAPLDDAECERLGAWLKKRGLQLSDLLGASAAAELAGWTDTAPSSDRILALLDRAPVLESCIESWERAGLWAIGRADPDYPKRLKRRLRSAAPAMLFGSGDRSLLNRGGIAIVGGDQAGSEAFQFIERFASLAAGAELSLISGSRNALEQAALAASRSRGGPAIAVLSGDLLHVASSVRPGRRDDAGKLVLVSPSEPNAAPALRDAAPAGRCVYGLCDTALVIAVGQDGGAWAGAVEAIEQEWVPLWVRGAGHEASRLIGLGAHGLPSDEIAPRALLTPPRATPARPGSTRRIELDEPATGPMAAAFLTPPGPSLVGFAEPPAIFGEAEPGQPSPPPPRGAHLRLVPSPVEPAGDGGRRLFEAFMRDVLLLLAEQPCTQETIASALELTTEQTAVWMKRAEGTTQLRLDPRDGHYHAVPTR